MYKLNKFIKIISGMLVVSIFSGHVAQAYECTAQAFGTGLPPSACLYMIPADDAAQGRATVERVMQNQSLELQIFLQDSNATDPDVGFGPSGGGQVHFRVLRHHNGQVSCYNNTAQRQQIYRDGRCGLNAADFDSVRDYMMADIRRVRQDLNNVFGTDFGTALAVNSALLAGIIGVMVWATHAPVTNVVYGERVVNGAAQVVTRSMFSRTLVRFRNGLQRVGIFLNDFLNPLDIMRNNEGNALVRNNGTVRRTFHTGRAMLGFIFGTPALGASTVATRQVISQLLNHDVRLSRSALLSTWLDNWFFSMQRRVCNQNIVVQDGMRITTDDTHAALEQVQRQLNNPTQGDANNPTTPVTRDQVAVQTLNNCANFVPIRDFRSIEASLDSFFRQRNTALNSDAGFFQHAAVEDNGHYPTLQRVNLR